MAITKNTFSISPTWTSTDLITQLQDAFSWAGQHGGGDSGHVVGLSTFTSGLVASGSGEEIFYDAKQSSTSGVGTDASFYIYKSSGQIQYIQVNSCGLGYTGGEVVTIPAAEFNGSSDIDITVAIAATVTGAVSYACTLTNSYECAGEDRNGAVLSTSGVSTTITIKEGDTIEFTHNTDSYSKYFNICGPGITSSSNASSYNRVWNGEYKADAPGTYSRKCSWTPLPGQAGEYYVRDDGTGYDYAPKIVVEPCTYSDVNVISIGSSTTFYDSSLVGVGTTATYAYGVIKHVIDGNKKYGTTFRAVSPRNSSGNAGVTDLRFWAGPRYFPHEYQKQEYFSYHRNGGHAYGKRYSGMRNLDTPHNADHDDGILSLPWSTTADTYCQNDYFRPKTGSNTGYQLDLNVYRSSLDPNFVVYSYKAPTLSSTHLNSNSFGCWFFHDYTTSLWDLDEQFLGGMTMIEIPQTGSTTTPQIMFRTHGYGMINEYSTSTGRGPTKRAGEFGYMPLDDSGYCSKYKTWYIESNTYPQQTNIDATSIYYRNRVDYPLRSSNASTGTGTALMSSNTDFNAVIKGIPLQAKWLPMPYFIPDDFVFIDFNYGTPNANIQQGDTVTVSGSEIYTVITGSYNQTSRTRGILFCARTT